MPLFLIEMQLFHHEVHHLFCVRRRIDAVEGQWPWGGVLCLLLQRDQLGQAEGSQLPRKGTPMHILHIWVYIGHFLQSALWVPRFCIHRFKDLQIKINNKKKSRKFQKQNLNLLLGAGNCLYSFYFVLTTIYIAFTLDEVLQVI